MILVLSWLLACTVVLVDEPCVDTGPFETDTDTGTPDTGTPDTGTDSGTTDTDTATDPDTDTAVDADSDGYAAADDCDDNEAQANPGLPETCDDLIDNDCDTTSNDCAPVGLLDLAAADEILIPGSAGTGAAIAAVPVDDLDGDGGDERLVGSMYSDAGDCSGGVSLITGVPAGTRSLDTALLTATGQASDLAGFALATDLDLDGDGVDELWIGAPGLWWVDRYSFTGCPAEPLDGAGRVYGIPETGTGTLALSAASLVLSGTTSQAHAGVMLTGHPDLDGTGAAGLLIGATDDDTNGTRAGAVYWVTGPITGAMDLDDATARLFGQAAEDQLGVGVELGDLDGDGVVDLLMSAPGDQYIDTPLPGVDRGTAYAVLGPVSGDVDLADADWLLAGDDPEDRLGGDIGTGGDLDADGYLDWVVAASGDDDARGVVSIFSGPLTGSETLADATATITGEQAQDSLGTTLDLSGDLDADGRSDLVLGAWRHPAGAHSGRAYLFLGPLSGAMNAADARATWGVADGSPQAAGYPVDLGGDFDGDGHDDLLIGALYAPDYDTNIEGWVYTLLGSGL